MKWGVIASCLGIAIPAIAVPAALLWSPQACADSWLPAETRTIVSPKGGCRLTVVPRDVGTGYFEGENGKTAGQIRGGNSVPLAILERRQADGNWTRIWSGTLVNDVAPVEALIDPDMRFVVTFDNWHFVGHGDDAIVIYDLSSHRTRALSVEKLLGQTFFDALPHSVSSVRWRNAAHIANGRLLIEIGFPEGQKREDNPPGVHLEIDLVTGEAVRRDRVRWQAADASADQVRAENLALANAVRIARAAPLHRPNGTDEREWHDYLSEAFSRLDPDWVHTSASTTYLRSRSAPDYAPSVAWVGNALADPMGDHIMIAGADPADLLAVIERAVAGVKPGSLRNARVYIVAPETARQRLTRALASSRAHLILIDPAQPIPQRPERMPRADGSLPSAFDFGLE